MIRVHIAPSTDPVVGRRGGRAMTSSISGSTPIASAGAESVTRSISQDLGREQGHDELAAADEAANKARSPAKTTPKTTVTTSPMFDDSSSAGLADLVEETRPCRTAARSSRSWLVREYHLRGFLGDLGADDAHGDADVGRCGAGASSTPSPVIATTSAIRLEGATMRSLCAERPERRPTRPGSRHGTRRR